jgi:hypothetical protein
MLSLTDKYWNIYFSAEKWRKILMKDCSIKDYKNLQKIGILNKSYYIEYINACAKYDNIDILVMVCKKYEKMSKKIYTIFGGKDINLRSRLPECINLLTIKKIIKHNSIKCIKFFIPEYINYMELQNDLLIIGYISKLMGRYSRIDIFKYIMENTKEYDSNYIICTSLIAACKYNQYDFVVYLTSNYNINSDLFHRYNELYNMIKYTLLNNNTRIFEYICSHIITNNEINSHPIFRYTLKRITLRLIKTSNIDRINYLIDNEYIDTKSDNYEYISVAILTNYDIFMYIYNKIKIINIDLNLIYTAIKSKNVNILKIICENADPLYFSNIPQSDGSIGIQILQYAIESRASIDIIKYIHSLRIQFTDDIIIKILTGKSTHIINYLIENNMITTDEHNKLLTQTQNYESSSISDSYDDIISYSESE